MAVAANLLDEALGIFASHEDLDEVSERRIIDEALVDDRVDDHVVGWTLRVALLLLKLVLVALVLVDAPLNQGRR
jgi:hypothetical protein